jgi:hypothetical protein
VADNADELYGLPLGEFTTARNDLEKRLRKDGKRDEAAEVKSLRKPTAPAWALNQVARERPKVIAELVKIGGQVRDAQEKLLAGGDRKTLDRATSAQRETTREVVRAAVEAAEAGDVGTGAAFEEKVGSTLRAAAADADVAEQLVAGRLVREQEAAGLFGFDAAVAAPARESAPPRKRGSSKRASTKTSSSKDRSAEAASRDAAAERRRAEESERKRLRALEAARKAEQRARGSAEAAQRATAKERTTAERALERLKEAETDENSARAKLEAAMAELERLDREGAEP